MNSENWQHTQIMTWSNAFFSMCSFIRLLGMLLLILIFGTLRTIPVFSPQSGEELKGAVDTCLEVSADSLTDVPLSGPTPVIPTQDDFEGVAKVLALAFAEKNSCGSLATGIAENMKNLNKLLKDHPTKLQHCRIVRDGNGEVIGACQLQLPGDVGNLALPEWARHELKPKEAYVEIIGVDPVTTGMGIGSALLNWAHTFAAQQGCTQIALEVMRANRGAVRLYARKGYVRQPPKCCLEQVITAAFIFCCMGFRYCSMLEMIKPLDGQSLL